MLRVEFESFSLFNGGDGGVRMVEKPGCGMASTHGGWSRLWWRQYATGSMLMDRWGVPPSGRRFIELQHAAS